MKFVSFSAWLALMACSASPSTISRSHVTAFTPLNIVQTRQAQAHAQTQAHMSPLFSHNKNDHHEKLSRRHNHNKHNPKNNHSIHHTIRSKMSRKVKPLSLALLTLLSLEKSHKIPLTGNPAAHASAPVMLMPKMKQMDPEEVAFEQYYKREDARVQAQMAERQRNMREIEARDGKEARIAYERAWDRERQAETDAKLQGEVALKRQLLNQGICPFVDPEGFRQITLYETGMDLAEFEGTQANMEKINQDKYPEQSQASKKRPHRFILQCKVQDLQRRGIDPLVYFEDHQRETTEILEMFPKSAQEMAHQYQTNLEQYGQIVPPKEGEAPLPPLADVMAAEAAAATTTPSDSKAAKAAAKAQEKERMAQEKAKAKEAKALAKAKAQELKTQAKEEAKAAKQAAKDEKVAAKAAAAAAAAATAATAAATAAASAGTVASELVTTATTMETTMESSTGESTAEGTVTTSAEESATADTDTTAAVSTTTTTTTTTKSNNQKIPMVPASAAFVVTAVGGGYAFKVYKDKADLAEEERQRQFQLIMGDNNSNDASDTFPGRALEEVDADMTGLLDDDAPPSTPPPPTTTSPSAASDSATTSEPTPKKKRGIKSMFSKRDANNRETDLTTLVSPGAQAPEFALLLAKILTFGAPGRFPQVLALPGEMPMAEFVLEEAKLKLLEFRTSAGLSDKESAEVFANVVNCMLIDIVDLASSTLREKDTKITVDAINIVVDYMNHAASLYDAVAGDVVINPVTYGGRLGKGKLEQMFTSYATSASVDQDRLQLLQDVFVISDKKVEGIMMKDMQKKMMAMMKGETPEGMEGMEEMMAAMGGMEGMEGGLPGMGGDMGDMPEPSAEETKQMLTALKDMKDAGMIPKEELVEVRKQFADSFGASIDELMAKADGDAEALSTEEKEMLDLMKSILDD